MFFQSRLAGLLLPLVLTAVFSRATGRVPPSSTSEAKLQDLFVQAREAQRRGDFQRSAGIYEEILRLRPGLAEAQANLGLMRHLLGEYEQAIQGFEAALRVNPQLFVPNLFLGLDLLRLQRPQRALRYLQRAQRLNPRDAQAALALGQAYVALQESEQANDWYRLASEITPTSSEAWYGLGLTYLALERSAAERLRKVGPNSPYADTLLAESLEGQDRTLDAIRLYEKVLASNPTLECGHAALGFAYIRQAALAAAETEFRTEIDNNSGCMLARLGLAHVAVERGKTGEALDQLRESWKADRNFVQANLACFLAGLQPERVHELGAQAQQFATGEGNEESALGKFLTSALETWQQGPTSGLPRQGDQPGTGPASENPSSRLTAGPAGDPRQLFRRGRYSQCAERLQPTLPRLVVKDLSLLARCAYYSGDYRATYLASGRWLKVHPRDPEALYWRARSSARLAVIALTRAGQADPNSVRVHLLLGDAFRAQQNYKEAEQEYRKALQLDPESFAARLGLATTFFQAFEFDDALPELRTALRLNSKDPEANYMMGEILVDRHQSEEAFHYLSRALNGQAASLARVHALLGKVYAAQGRTAEAVAELKESLQGDSDGSYHYQLYQLYRKLGDHKAAAAALEQSENIRRQRQAEGAARVLGPLPSPASVAQ
ncbi:MAG: tetratricopeptide repeat protein [Acidobacteriia bacterium]|nr:tetratricopeptide repeat protein [Terriglobia bacterium]